MYLGDVDISNLTNVMNNVVISMVYYIHCIADGQARPSRYMYMALRRATQLKSYGSLYQISIAVSPSITSWNETSCVWYSASFRSLARPQTQARKNHQHRVSSYPRTLIMP